jgi:DNA polymerase-1
MPDELRLQLKHIRSVTPLLGAVKIEREGIEADDLLASFAVREAARNKTVVIASSDKDFAQLVSERISLYVPPSPRSESGKWSKMDISAVDRKFGVHPRCIVDYLSLVGDSADNISGVRGFGIKTAAKWLKCYGSIDGIRDHLGALPKRLAQNFRDSEKTMELNRSIVRFDTSIDVQEISEVSIDVDLLLKFLMEFELYDLADRLQSRRVGQQQLACMQ